MVTLSEYVTGANCTSLYIKTLVCVCVCVYVVCVCVCGVCVCVCGVCLVRQYCFSLLWSFVARYFPS